MMNLIFGSLVISMLITTATYSCKTQTEIPDKTAHTISLEPQQIGGVESESNSKIEETRDQVVPKDPKFDDGTKEVPAPKLVKLTVDKVGPTWVDLKWEKLTIDTKPGDRYFIYEQIGDNSMPTRTEIHNPYEKTTAHIQALKPNVKCQFQLKVVSGASAPVDLSEPSPVVEPTKKYGCGHTDEVTTRSTTSKHSPWNMELRIAAYPEEDDAAFRTNRRCGAILVRVDDDLEKSNILATLAQCVLRDGQSITKHPSLGFRVVPLERSSNVDIVYHVDDVLANTLYNDDTKENDIALVRLKETIYFDDDNRAVCRPKRTDELDKMSCRVVHWGRDNQRQEMPLSIFEDNECKTELNGPNGLNGVNVKGANGVLFRENEMFCGGTLDQEHKFGVSDRGRAVECRPKNQANGPWTVCGLTSFFFPTSNTDRNELRKSQNAVFTRVSALSGWIDENIKDFSKLVSRQNEP